MPSLPSSSTDLKQSSQMTQPRLAWAIEIMAITMGVILAIYAGIEGSSGGILGLFIATLPFLALTTVELTKIPLVQLAFSVKSIIWKAIAIAGLLVVTLATFENFVFGFERGFTERLAQVTDAEINAQQASAAQERAKSVIPDLEARRNDITQRLEAIRDEMVAIRDQAQKDIQDTREASNITSELLTERERFAKEIAAVEQRRVEESNRERRRCSVPEIRCNFGPIEGVARRQREELQKRLDGVNQQAVATRSRADHNAAAARARRDSEIQAKEQERNREQEALDNTRVELLAAQTSLHESAKALGEATKLREELTQKSQIHRLSSVLFGNHDPVSVDMTKKIFVVSLAAIVALIGTLIATLHFAALRAVQARPSKLTMAIRAYYARKRRRVPITIRDIQRLGAFQKLLSSARRWVIHRRRRTRIIEIEKPVERLKLIYVALDTDEEKLAAIRKEYGFEIDREKTDYVAAR